MKNHMAKDHGNHTGITYFSSGSQGMKEWKETYTLNPPLLFGDYAGLPGQRVRV